MYFYDIMESFLNRINFKIDIAAHSELGPEWHRSPASSDPFNRIYYIESGEGFLKHAGKLRTLKPGGLHLIPANSKVSFGCKRKIIIDWMHFSASTAEGLELFQILDCKLDIRPENPRKIRADLSSIRKTMSDKSLAAALLRQSNLFSILACFASNVQPGENMAKMESLRRFAVVLKLIEADAANPPSVPMMAKKMKMATASFSRLFKAHFGKSPSRFIMARRIASAEKLVEEGERKLEDIASDLGFSDSFHLSKSFKQWTGLSPRDYRQTKFAKLP
ncbi:MAG: hypothetical protein A2X49_12440 [Lentisphaerae bacterium GWF2_52_8]|nr:MAG: hypothetical protein A2X49_12440 [Lentisphaerae bacterium GWF2_52_8]